MARKDAPTNAIARERLKAVLEADRGHLTGKPLELFKRDVATVLTSYMEFEEDSVDVAFERVEGGETSLYIKVSAVKVRRAPAQIDECEIRV